jgi:hypothetical protein
MSNLTVHQYVPKVPHSATHKLPAQPRWIKPIEGPVKSLPVSAKVVEDDGQQEKPATVSELMSQENPLSKANKAQSEFRSTPRCNCPV